MAVACRDLCPRALAGTTGTMACNPFSCLLWLLLLLFVSFPVASLSFMLFMLVGPLAGCCKGLEPLADLLVGGVRWPQTCAKNMCPCRC